MEVSVCNGRVIKSCMDPIWSLWRAGIAIEMVYPPQLPLDWDSWSLKIEILQESQPTLRFALLYIDAMEVSVCNGRVIKSCMDPISSLWRAGIAIEMVYPPQLPTWLGFVVPQQNRDFARISAYIKVCTVVYWCHGGECPVKLVQITSDR